MGTAHCEHYSPLHGDIVEARTLIHAVLQDATIAALELGRAWYGSLNSACYFGSPWLGEMEWGPYSVILSSKNCFCPPR